MVQNYLISFFCVFHNVSTVKYPWLQEQLVQTAQWCSKVERLRSQIDSGRVLQLAGGHFNQTSFTFDVICQRHSLSFILTT